MAITSESVREIFKGLENGDGAAFFERVADDVDWTVMGTHPLAGHYPSKKAFVEGTFSKLSQVLPKGAQLHDPTHFRAKNDDCSRKGGGRLRRQEVVAKVPAARREGSRVWNTSDERAGGLSATILTDEDRDAIVNEKRS